MRHLNEFSCSYEHIIIEAGFFQDGKISEHETRKSNVSDAGRGISYAYLLEQLNEVIMSIKQQAYPCPSLRLKMSAGTVPESLCRMGKLE